MTTYYYIKVKEKGRRDKHVHVSTNKEKLKKNQKKLEEEYGEMEVVDSGSVEGDIFSVHAEMHLPNIGSINED